MVKTRSTPAKLTTAVDGMSSAGSRRFDDDLRPREGSGPQPRGIVGNLGLDEQRAIVNGEWRD